MRRKTLKERYTVSQIRRRALFRKSLGTAILTCFVDLDIIIETAWPIILVSDQITLRKRVEDKRISDIREITRF
jgi:hypothetical protein